MSRTLGKLVVCDRCRNKTFICATNTDRNYLRASDFEPVPPGWKVYDGNDLCPCCSAEWERIRNGFMNISIGSEQKNEKL